METVEKKEAALVAEKLLQWFTAHKRPLPWRKNYAPYAVWISEMMLQQTQMERGVSYFLRWMERFPTINDVAVADEENILHAWEGLGYYRRARYIHMAAKQMQSRFAGKLPRKKEDLEKLPGLGTYTVAAIMGIAYNENVTCVDANVERVLSRLYNIEISVKKGPGAAMVAKLSQMLLPIGRAREYNQAMMELGALVCGKKPECGACPLAGHCRAKKLGVALERPLQEKKAAITAVDVAYGVLQQEGAVLVQKRSAKGLWGGLWQFPELDFWKMAEKGALLGTFRHSYTNHRLTARFYEVKAAKMAPSSQDVRFLPLAEGRDAAMPAHHRKMMDKLMAEDRQLWLL